MRPSVGTSSEYAMPLNSRQMPSAACARKRFITSSTTAVSPCTRTIQIMNCGAREQECANAIKLRIAGRNLFGTIADLLNPTQHTVGLDRSLQGAPATLHDRLVFGSVGKNPPENPSPARDEDTT